MSFRLLLVSYALLLFSGKLSDGRRLLHTESVAPPKERFVGSFISQLTIPNAKPYDTAHLKVLYPATANFSSISKVPTEGSFPVVLFFAGAEVESSRYQWLGEELVRSSEVVFVSYDHIDTFDGESFFFTPYFSQNGTQIPPCSTILSLLEKLSELNNTGVLAGKLDLERVIIGGHSLGGHFALRGADSEFLPSLKGVFTYGAPNTNDLPGGPPTGSIHPLPGTVPHLLIEGTRDGLLQRARSPNATNSDNASVPISRTFLEGLFSGRAACYVELNGANHMAMLNPDDQTLRSTSLDFESTIHKRKVERMLAQIIIAFVQRLLMGDTLTSQDYQSTLSFHNEVLSNVVCNI